MFPLWAKLLVAVLVLDLCIAAEESKKEKDEVESSETGYSGNYYGNYGNNPYRGAAGDYRFNRRDYSDGRYYGYSSSVYPGTYGSSYGRGGYNYNINDNRGYPYGYDRRMYDHSYSGGLGYGNGYYGNYRNQPWDQRGRYGAYGGYGNADYRYGQYGYGNLGASHYRSG